MRADAAGAIARVTGRRCVGAAPLGGGCVGEVFRVDLEGGDRLVAKLGRPSSGLALEGRMLRHLASHGALPVPAVIHAEDTLLLMTWVEGGDAIDSAAEEHAAGLVAALHDITSERFGFAYDTVIGGLHQPNPENASWLPFFRDHRLLFMARQALDAGRLPARLMARIEALAGRLGRWLDEPAQPSLIHGDLWGGNVLAHRGKIAAFVDPAIYHADAEIELAFATLFNTFGERFFRRYGELRRLAPGFFEERRDLYNLYPLLVHVRLFGGSYAASVERTLERFGC